MRGYGLYNFIDRAELEARQCELGNLIRSVKARVVKIVGDSERISLHLGHDENPSMISFPLCYGAPVRVGDVVKADYICANLLDNGKVETNSAGFVIGMHRKKFYELRNRNEKEDAFRIMIGMHASYGPNLSVKEVVDVVGLY